MHLYWWIWWICTRNNSPNRLNQFTKYMRCHHLTKAMTKTSNHTIKQSHTFSPYQFYKMKMISTKIQNERQNKTCKRTKSASSSNYVYTRAITRISWLYQVRVIPVGSKSWKLIRSVFKNVNEWALSYQFCCKDLSLCSRLCHWSVWNDVVVKFVVVVVASFDKRFECY